MPPADPTVDAVNAGRWEDGAAHWAETADARYPARGAFWDTFTRELAGVFGRPVRILELGSGPGFLAERILRAGAASAYTLVDISPAMHDLARARLAAHGDRLVFVTANYGRPGWDDGLGAFDAVVSLQAVHEVRRKDRVAPLYAALRPRLEPGGLALICDRYLTAEHPGDETLHMTRAEHEAALREGGFSDVRMLHAAAELAMFRAVA